MKYLFFFVTFLLSLSLEMAHAEIAVSDQSAKALWEAFDKKENTESPQQTSSSSTAKIEPVIQENQISTNSKNINTSQNLPWLRTAVSFVAVISLILFLGLSFGSKLKKISTSKSTSSILRVIQTVNIGIKKQVVVMEYEGVKVLVGVTPQGMNMLYAHEPKGAVDTISKTEIATEEVLQGAQNFDVIHQAYTQAMNQSHISPQPEPITISQKVKQALKQMRSFKGKTVASETLPVSFTPKPIEEEAKAKAGHFFYS